MTTELPPVVVSTPTAATIVTPVIKRRLWGRALDGFLIVLAAIVGLADFVGAFDLTTLGLTGVDAARIWFGILIARFALTFLRPKLVELKTEPADSVPGGPQ